MVEHYITSKDVTNNEAARQNHGKKMRKANFKLPYQKCMDTEQSTYKNKISDMVESNSLNPGRAQILSNLKDSSIGNFDNKVKLECVTEAAQQYIKPNQDGATTSQNKQLKAYLKGHHFDFGAKTTKNEKYGL